MKLGRILSVALVTCLPLGASAAPIFVSGGQTSVSLDVDLLGSVGLELSGVSPAVIIPGTLPGSVAFPINPRETIDPVRPTTFVYEEIVLFPVSGTIEHTGSVFFNNDAIEVGNFSIGFDVGRVGGDASGFFVESTVGLEAILFDLGVTDLSAASELLAVLGDLLVSPEFAAILQAVDITDLDLTGTDVGNALVEGTVPEPTTALLLGIGLVALAGSRRRSATS